MAISNTNRPRTFIPELWSADLIKAYKEAHDIFGGKKPKRSRGAQLLRDAALGYPEFPDNKGIGDSTNAPYRTATEIRMQDHMADAAAYQLAYAIDRDILDKLRKQKR